jgi:glycosyltransferase involved in cell wall biosynthesis
VDLENFRLNTERDTSKVVILCTAALDDRRKGGKLLMRAFNAIKVRWLDAILRISCRLTEEDRVSLLSHVEERWRNDVEFPGPGSLSDLSGLLGSATVTVLASRWEAFGMVVVESLATGTPVAATRDGALPEILDDPAVGRLFDPGPETEPEPVNLEGLIEAIFACIELSRDPATPERCRKHAQRYGWDVIGPRIEEMIASAAHPGVGRKASDRAAASL